MSRCVTLVECFSEVFDPRDSQWVFHELTDILALAVIAGAKGWACQKKIARQIVQGDGDYVLAVKGNQEKLHAAIVEHFEQLHEDDFQDSACRRRQTQENRSNRHW